VNSNLGRQHTKAPLAAALSPFVSLLYPPNPWCEWCDEWRLTTTPLVHAHVIHPWKYPDLHTQKVERSANKTKPPEQSPSAKTQPIQKSYSPGTQPLNIFLCSSKQHPLPPPLPLIWPQALPIFLASPLFSLDLVFLNLITFLLNTYLDIASPCFSNNLLSSSTVKPAWTVTCFSLWLIYNVKKDYQYFGMIKGWIFFKGGNLATIFSVPWFS